MKLTLGALKPKIDLRDYVLQAGSASLPEFYMCDDMPPVKSQGSVGSCVAHATATILEYFNMVEHKQYNMLSTNFIYAQGSNTKSSGMYLRDACKIVKEYGDALEVTIPGNTEKPKCIEETMPKIDDKVLAEAANFRVRSYAQCKDANAIKKALIENGPVLGSVKWYDDYTIKGNILSFDETSEPGYHAIVICGYNEDGWLIQNSWGRFWNGDGQCVIPYNIPIREAWSFVDANSDDVYIPRNNRWLNWLYKIVNLVINFFKR